MLSPPSVVLTGWNVFNQDALFKGYKKRLGKLPKAKTGSDSTKMVNTMRWMLSRRLEQSVLGGGVQEMIFMGRDL